MFGPDPHGAAAPSRTLADIFVGVRERRDIKVWEIVP